MLVLQEFIRDLEQVHERLVLNDGSGLESFLSRWKIVGSIGDCYQELQQEKHKKGTGSFYTPHGIVEHMVMESTCTLEDRILDPACGDGRFLCEVYRKLLYSALAEGRSESEAARQLIGHCLHGCDLDPVAVLMTRIELYRLSGILSTNIVCQDFLFSFEGEFDLILGNPPYMGHKVMEGDYRNRLYQSYGTVFYDKADLSYCFIKQSIELLKQGGQLMFITSRYMIEAANGHGIREFLLEQGWLQSLTDFYGVRLIKGAKVDTVILKYVKGVEAGDTTLVRLDWEAEEMGAGLLEQMEDGRYAAVITMPQAMLRREGFLFLRQEENRILGKIRGNRLSEVCTSHQGIITGLDKAFILTRLELEALGSECEGLVQPWIKSRQVQPFQVEDASLWLIYSNLIVELENHEQVARRLEAFKDRLSNRRECRSGARRWFDLQWGRSLELFMEEKVVFPYKASSNRFAVDRGHCFSADVYALKLRPGQLEKGFSHDLLAVLLNSSLYEFYVKTMAKKLGRDLYEYYPNKLMQLIVPIPDLELERAAARVDKADRLSIDKLINDYFNITVSEYERILDWCAKE